MAEPVVWRGTAQESSDLLTAVARNCACTYDLEVGMRTSMCPSHEMMLDQHALDRLLFARWRLKSSATEELPE